MKILHIKSVDFPKYEGDLYIVHYVEHNTPHYLIKEEYELIKFENEMLAILVFFQFLTRKAFSYTV